MAGVNFRGCCGNENNQPGQYHLGFTADMKLVLEKLKAHNEASGSNKPIYLSGFSLGANVILKLLGELGVAAKVRYIKLNRDENFTIVFVYFHDSLYIFMCIL